MVPKKSHLLFREWLYTNTGAFAWLFSYDFNGKDYECPSSLLAELLFAEYKFRYQAQLKASLKKNNADENRAIDIQYDELENDLYLKEAAMPEWPLKTLYDSLREEPAWYLRTGLIDDCAARGGCCARKCGCCVKRLQNLPRKGISGHCSLACPCCDKKEGQNPGSERVATMHRQYKKALEGDNPFHLARLASLYFAKLEPFSYSERQPHGGNPQVTGACSSSGTEPTNCAIEGENADESFHAGPPPYEQYASRARETNSNTSNTY